MNCLRGDHVSSWKSSKSHFRRLLMSTHNENNRVYSLCPKILLTPFFRIGVGKAETLSHDTSGEPASGDAAPQSASCYRLIARTTEQLHCYPAASPRARAATDVLSLHLLYDMHSNMGKGKTSSFPEQHTIRLSWGSMRPSSRSSCPQ